jgi:hypothetical protein
MLFFCRRIVLPNLSLKVYQLVLTKRFFHIKFHWWPASVFAALAKQNESDFGSAAMVIRLKWPTSTMNAPCPAPCDSTVVDQIRKQLEAADPDEDAGSNLELVIIGGAQRSGTTLLQNIFDSHTEVYGGPEFLHLVDIIGLRNLLNSSVRKQWIDCICTEPQVNRQVRNFICGFFQGLAALHGAHLLSEKSPDNVMVFSELSELLPEAKFIWVLRDPRAVISSLLEVGRRAGNKGQEVPHMTSSFDAALQHVKPRIEKGLEFFEAQPERVAVVCYERLVRQPRGEIERLCHFLGLDWQEAMLHPAEVRHDGEAAITRNSGEIWYDRLSYSRNPSAVELGKWRKLLKPQEQLAVCQEFADCVGLREFGYDMSPESLDPAVLKIGRRRLSLRRRRNRLRKTILGAARRLGL